MEIYVSGEGKKIVSPDEVKITIRLNCKDSDYNKAIEKGIKNRAEIIQKFIKISFKKKSIKTNNFLITEEKRYNETTKIYEKVGYIFSENSEVSFDYENNLLFKVFSNLSELDSAPTCEVSFNIKDKEACIKVLLDSAYKKALFQAECLAKASNSKIKECKKISFKPFDDLEFGSNSFEFAPRMAKVMQLDNRNNFELTPKDIELSETVYCLFIAE